MSDQGGEDPAARSGILKAEFGVNWRWWRWFRFQFNPTSLGAIGAIIVTCGSYIVHLRESVVQVRERVVVLETKVIPFVQDQGELEGFKAELTDHDQRIGRLESNWDTAQAQAGTAPSTRRARGQR